MKQLRERWPEVRSAHRRIVREAFAAHGGDEVDTQGDSFFYVFGRARDAALAAAEAQRGLAAHEWPDGRRDPRPHRHAHRRAGRVGGGLPRHRRAPRGPDHGRGPRRAGAALGGDGGGAARRGGRRRQRPRPRRAPAQGPRPARARLPARRRRARAVVPEDPHGGRGEGRIYRRPLVIGATAGVLAAAVAIPVFALAGGSGGDVVRPEGRCRGQRGRRRRRELRHAHQQATGVDEPHGAAAGAGAIWVTSGGGASPRSTRDAHRQADDRRRRTGPRASPSTAATSGSPTASATPSPRSPPTPSTRSGTTRSGTPRPASPSATARSG